MKKRKLKDQEHVEARIKISKIIEVFKQGALTEFKDKLICVHIDKGYMSSDTAFKDNKKGKKELLKFIKEELYL